MMMKILKVKRRKQQVEEVDTNSVSSTTPSDELEKRTERYVITINIRVRKEELNVLKTRINSLDFEKKFNKGRDETRQGRQKRTENLSGLSKFRTE